MRQPPRLRLCLVLCLALVRVERWNKRRPGKRRRDGVLWRRRSLSGSARRAGIGVGGGVAGGGLRGCWKALVARLLETFSSPERGG